MRTALLVPHITAGVLGLVVGPVAMFAPKRRGRHTNAGLFYQGIVAVLTTTAIALALLDFIDLWPFVPIAVGTEAAALAGWWVKRRRFRGWLPVHVQLMCGSYVSFVTAFLVVNWDSWLAWVIPTVVATPLIGWASINARPAAPVVTAARST